MKLFKSFLTLLFLSLVFFACEKKENEDPENTNNDNNTPTEEINGSLTFNGTKYDLSAASYQLDDFELEKSGRFHQITLIGPSITEQDGDIGGSGIYLSLGVMTDANNIKNIVGDFSNAPTWTNNNDARTAPDYSLQESEGVIFENDDDVAEIEIETVTEFTIIEGNGEYTISLKGEGYRYTNSDEQGTIEINFTGPITFVDDYIIPSISSLGSPQFTASVPTNKKILNTVWTGSKLWSFTNDCSDLLELDNTTGDTLQVISQCDGDPNSVGSLYYLEGELYGTYTQALGNGPFTFFRKLDASTAAYTNDWNYDGSNGEIRQDSYLASNGSSIYAVVDVIENGGAPQNIAKFDLTGSFEEIVMDAEYDHMIYGGSSFWAIEDRGDDGMIYQLDNDLKVKKSYFIDNHKTLADVQFGGEYKMYLVYMNAELWIVDLDNNFYKTGIN